METDEGGGTGVLITEPVDTQYKTERETDGGGEKSDRQAKIDRNG